MLYPLLKAVISGALIAVASEVAKRYPGVGALIASLPLVSVLGMLWLWHDKPDPVNMAAHAQSTFWFVLPSLPMFLLIPVMLRRGATFGMALVCGCLLTVLLYLAMVLVMRLFTDHADFELAGGKIIVRRLAPGLGRSQLQNMLGLELD